MKKIYYLILLLMLSLSFVNAQTLEEKQWIVNGNNFYLQKEYDKARVEYSKVLATTPSSLKANYNLGNTFFQLKKYDDAITHYNRASKITSGKKEKSEVFHNLGNAYMQKKEYKKAIESFKNALRNNPKDNETRYNFALAKKLLENQEKQKNQNPPDLPKPTEFAKEMKAKADSLAQGGKFNLALGLMKQAVEKDSTVMHFQTFMDKLNEVIILDSITIK